MPRSTAPRIPDLPTFTEYLVSLRDRDDEQGDVARAVAEAGARPTTAAGLVTAARTRLLPLSLVDAARVAADAYLELREAALLAEGQRRAVAEHTAVVVRVSRSWDGVHLLEVECSRCRRTLLHGAGHVGSSPILGHRQSHCACPDGYVVVDPGGLTRSLAARHLAAVPA